MHASLAERGAARLVGPEARRLRTTTTARQESGPQGDAGRRFSTGRRSRVPDPAPARPRDDVDHRSQHFAGTVRMVLITINRLALSLIPRCEVRPTASRHVLGPERVGRWSQPIQGVAVTSWGCSAMRPKP